MVERARTSLGRTDTRPATGGAGTAGSTGPATPAAPPARGAAGASPVVRTGSTRVADPVVTPFDGRGTAVVVGCVAFLLGLSAVVWFTGRPGHDIETVTPTATVVRLPAGVTRCPTSGALPLVYAGNAQTSCGLAAATLAALGERDHPGTVDVASPVSGRILTLACSGERPTTCRGGGAVVHVVPRTDRVVVDR